MIKANELRIGNWINDSYGKSLVVSYHHIRYATIYPENGYVPIPLTPEVLEKLGFLKEEMADGFSDYSLNGVRISLPYFEFTYDAGDCNIEVKHLHQLQNLIFSLSGQELNITL